MRTDTKAKHWKEVLQTKPLSESQRAAAEKVLEWMLKSEQIDRDVHEGKISSSEDEDSARREIGGIPAKITVGGNPVCDRFFVGRSCFTFDHYVTNGFKFSVNQ